MTSFLRLKRLFNIQEDIGFSQEEIESTIERFGSLPKILIEYYRQFGKHYTLNHVQNNLVEPSKLEELNGYLIFYTENQYVAQWGISVKDLTQENPLVYVTYDEETFYQECDALSKFLNAMAFLNICFSMEYSIEEIYFINKDVYDKIRSKYNLVAKINWCDMEIYQNHNDSIIYMAMHSDNDIELFYSSNSEKHFNELNSYIIQLTT